MMAKERTDYDVIEEKKIILHDFAKELLFDFLVKIMRNKNNKDNYLVEIEIPLKDKEGKEGIELFVFLPDILDLGYSLIKASNSRGDLSTCIFLGLNSIIVYCNYWTDRISIRLDIIHNGSLRSISLHSHEARKLGNFLVDLYSKYKSD